MFNSESMSSAPPNICYSLWCRHPQSLLLYFWKTRCSVSTVSLCNGRDTRSFSSLSSYYPPNGLPLLPPVPYSPQTSVATTLLSDSVRLIIFDFAEPCTIIFLNWFTPCSIMTSTSLQMKEALSFQGWRASQALSRPPTAWAITVAPISQWLWLVPRMLGSSSVCWLLPISKSLNPSRSFLVTMYSNQNLVG